MAGKFNRVMTDNIQLPRMRVSAISTPITGGIYIHRYEGSMQLTRGQIPGIDFQSIANYAFYFQYTDSAIASTHKSMPLRVDITGSDPINLKFQSILVDTNSSQPGILGDVIAIAVMY